MSPEIVQIRLAGGQDLIHPADWCCIGGIQHQVRLFAAFAVDCEHDVHKTVQENHDAMVNEMIKNQRRKHAQAQRNHGQQPAQNIDADMGKNFIHIYVGKEGLEPSTFRM